MRIISGTFKGRKIERPQDNKTRPLKDLTKESIFNILTHSNKLKINLINSKVLDLFSGVGSFGIECLSRGAKKVVFVENYSDVLLILKKNLNNLKSNSDYKIIKQNIYDNFFFKNLEREFDLIFLDPPYKENKLEIIFRGIKDNEILSENGIIIMHRHKDEEEILIPGLEIIEKKTYGISKILFFSFLK